MQQLPLLLSLLELAGPPKQPAYCLAFRPQRDGFDTGNWITSAGPLDTQYQDDLKMLMARPSGVVQILANIRWGIWIRGKTGCWALLWHGASAEAANWALPPRQVLEHLLNRLRGADLSVGLDPLTGLLTRSAFMQALGRLAAPKQGIALFKIRIQDFARINRLQGEALGDHLLAQLSSQLEQQRQPFGLRSSCLGRFGGALFTLAVAGQRPEQIHNLARRLANLALAGADTRLAVGVAWQEADALQSSKAVHGLVVRAEHALEQAESGNDKVCVLPPGEKLPPLAELAGIFTTDAARDYRNMSVYWDLSRYIAGEADPDLLFNAFAKRLAQSFPFQYLALFDSSEDEPELFQGVSWSAQGMEPISALPSSLAELASAGWKHGGMVESGRWRLAGFPLAKGRFMLMAGEQSTFDLGEDELALLSAVAQQLDIALERHTLSARLDALHQAERAKLEQQVDTLNTALERSRILSTSSAMDDLLKRARRAASVDSTVLITGESGTGKERLAHFIYHLGRRKDKPMVVVDCGAIPESLFESELFGHVKGAFTGAGSHRDGLIHQAQGGILLLDEIGELPLSMQTRLLRFVQEKTYSPVGSSDVIPADIQIIAATNRDLDAEVKAGRFRSDLFYRLNVLTLHCPPLRQRQGDVSLLAQYFVNRYNLEQGAEKTLAPDVLKRLEHHPWTGNVRELEHAITQGAIFSDGAVIQWQDLGLSGEPVVMPEPVNERVLAHLAGPEVSPSAGSLALPDVLLELVKEVLSTGQSGSSPLGSWLQQRLLEKSYQACGGDARLTAVWLGITQSTVRRRLKRLDDQPLSPGLESWPLVEQALDARVEQVPDVPSLDLKGLRQMLFEVLMSQPQLNGSQMATLLAVSEPTLYKLKREWLASQV